MVFLSPFDPEEAIFVTDPLTGTKSVDPVKYIIGLLMKNWDTRRTSGHKPQFGLAEMTKDIMFNADDYIVIYTVSRVSRQATLNYSHVTQTTVFSVDIFTSRDREHMAKMVEECNRILYANATDTFGDHTGLEGRFWIQPVRDGPYDRIQKQYYRTTMDWQIRWIYRPTPGR